ncbi:tRNA pseudouridine(13) synthase TruD [Candidatus Woesearchaeota archaeon]|nr:tRNA pseudouridine(13) synthase TruD [Candidatus Woesearchaeota archaeon]
MLVKQIPKDFYVEELINIKPKAQGDYTYFWLIKKNWTTMRAVQQISKACRASKRRFKFAGTKDKFAITTQAVSAFKISADALEKIDLKDIKIEIIGKGDKQISLGDLEGNKFEIIVRDLIKKDLEKLNKKAEGIKSGFKNFFGPQRFGRGNTHLIGKEITKGKLQVDVEILITFIGDKETETAQRFREFAKDNWGKWKQILSKAPKFLGIEKNVLNWLVKHPTDFAGALRKVSKPIRKLYVHAYQSWIFNKALHKLGKKDLPEKVPVPGFKTKLGKDTFSREIKKILKQDNIKLEDFKCIRIPELSSEGTERKTIIKPKQFKVGKPEKDELNKGKQKIKLQFELPKGIYATVLIGELFDEKN